MNLAIENKIILGGLVDQNLRSEELRALQIRDGFRIHTCNDYKNSLEVIKNASRGQENKLKLISKVYYRYPDSQNRRLRPLKYQLDEIINRLGFVPYDWTLQLCCYCRFQELICNNAQKFFREIKEKYKIKKVYLEYYPIYNYNFIDIIKLNNFYKKEISFGVMGYQNLFNRAFHNNNLKFFSLNYIDVCFLGILGKGIQNKISHNHLIKENANLDLIDANISYFLLNNFVRNNIQGITHVSSLKHYEDLKNRFSKIDEIISEKSSRNYLFAENFVDKYYFYTFDQYGGIYNLKTYISDPKLLISKIKHLLISYIKSLKFGTNYWG